LGENGLPFQLIFTKSDKQSKVKTDQSVAKFRKSLLEIFEEVPAHYITSAETQEGRDEILSFISGLNKSFTR
jgi:GTP-binding protein